MDPRESVTLALILRDIAEKVSVSRIREAVSGADFDILEVGSLSDRMRRDGARRWFQHFAMAWTW